MATKLKNQTYQKPLAVIIENLLTGQIYSLQSDSVFGSRQRLYTLSRTQIMDRMYGPRSSWCASTILSTSVFRGTGRSLDVIRNGIPWRIYGPLGCIPAYGASYVSTAMLPYVYVQDSQTARSAPKARSVLKAFSALNESKVSGGLMLMELGETLKLLTNPLNGSVKLMSRLWKSAKKSARKRYKKPTAKHYLDAASNQWLEYRYGIMPLVMDASEVYDAFHERLKTYTALIHTARGSASDVWSTKIDRYDGSRYVAPLGVSLTTHWTGVLKTEQTSTTVLYYVDTGYSSLLKVMSSVGLGLNNIPGLIWERIPFSFVGDWFFDVGAWLQAISPNPGVQVKGSSTSTKLSNTWTIQPTYTAYNTKVIGNEGIYFLNQSELIREQSPSMPSLPTVNLGENWRHIVDSLTLTWGNLPRVFKRRKLR